jgi:hypothetical protein
MGTRLNNWRRARKSAYTEAFQEHFGTMGRPTRP